MNEHVYPGKASDPTGDYDQLLVLHPWYMEQHNLPAIEISLMA
jgi:hypothetical protein